MSAEKAEGVTDEQLEKYLEHEMSWTRILKERFEKELKSKPPLPPWLKYPEPKEWLVTYEAFRH